jgi:NAD+ diphosphatase
MPHSFLARLPLTRFEVDRDAAARAHEHLLDSLWADPATRILPMLRGNAPMAGDGLALLPVDAVPLPGLRVYLGRSLAFGSPEPVGTPIVAVQLDDAAELAPAFADLPWANLRDVGHLLSDRDAGLLAEAVAVLNWHDSHRFSPRTGEPTTVEQGGWVRRDPATGAELFPRTDPAVIVAVLDADDRILLGSNALWEPNRYSLLAGFVEPGETLETAIEREIFEESGVHVIDPVYLGSQPWPFPASLMLGFTARADPDRELAERPDGTEILELRWFSRDELAGSIGDVLLPGPTSIARGIIEHWFGGLIEDGSRP